ncbi:MAG: hypothetical protein NVV63_10585 [Opitutus sp.]|nr:hypothetical protein [Opitutus sp.]
MPFIFIAGVGFGLSYGIGVGTIRRDREVVTGMEKSESDSPTGFFASLRMTGSMVLP